MRPETKAALQKLESIPGTMSEYKEPDWWAMAAAYHAIMKLRRRVRPIPMADGGVSLVMGDEYECITVDNLEGRKLTNLVVYGLRYGWKLNQNPCEYYLVPIDWAIFVANMPGFLRHVLLTLRHVHEED